MKKLWVLLCLLCALMIGTAGATTVNGAGTALGFMGDITVTITLVDGVIANVQIDHSETQQIGGYAAEKLPERIVASNSLNVDVVAGATVTSKAVLTAAKNALLAAGLDPDDYMDEVSSEPEVPPEPDEDDPVIIPDDAIKGTAKGMSGEVTVGLVIKNGKIIAVYIDHDDTPSIAGFAVEKLPERIVASNSLDVDVVAGATVTSNAILAAAKNALLSAGLDPNDYMGKTDAATESGDSDEDGRVTVKDAIFVLQYCMGKNVSINLDVADVTGDGKVNENDVLRILQYAAGWNVTLK